MDNSLHTAEEMFAYFQENRYGPGWSKNQGINHFQVIENALLSPEKVFMTFVGQHNFVTNTKHDGYAAYAITNKRIVMGQSSTISGEKLQTFNLDEITGVTSKAGMAFIVMRIQTTEGVLSIGLDKQSGEKTVAKVRATIDQLKDN
jgi:hypothetical protein